MKASVEAICYKVRPLKNGEYPLMLRITKSRKRKYVSKDEVESRKILPENMLFKIGYFVFI